MKCPQSEIHLCPVALPSGSAPVRGVASAGLAPLPLPFAPVRMVGDAKRPELRAWDVSPARADVGLEPFADTRNRLRLLASFPMEATPQVNGSPAPGVVVLSPGDVFHWTPGISFRVALFHRPRIGPPPKGAVGKPCPVCRVPISAASTCVCCVCGVVLHCEPDDKKGLQCAQMRRTCPVCLRPILLTEGYVNPPDYEE